MTKAEKYVRSIYPNAEVQFTMTGRRRIVSEPTMNGYWLGDSFEFDSEETAAWKTAMEYLQKLTLIRLER